MFIRKRHVKGPNGTVYTYFAIVEAHRVDGKVRQRLLYNMGVRSTIAEAIAHEQKQLAMFQRWLYEGRESTQRICEYLQSRIDWLQSARRNLDHCKRSSDKNGARC